jgi:N-acylglucosamine 2-epimerase
MHELLRNLPSERVCCTPVENAGEPKKEREHGSGGVRPVGTDEGGKDAASECGPLFHGIEEKRRRVPTGIAWNEAEPSRGVKQPVTAPAGKGEQGETAIGDSHGGRPEARRPFHWWFARSGAAGRAVWGNYERRAEDATAIFFPYRLWSADPHLSPILMNTPHRSPDFAALDRQYRSALLDDVLPFWERHSIDAQQGGYFTCLERDGTVFDTDKFVWLQCRQAWLFAMLYHALEPRPRWLEIARHGIDFLKAHGRDSSGNWYFSLARNGAPLLEPYNIFSDCFAAMAFSGYARASGDGESKEIALTTYQKILERKENPKGRFSKAVPGARPLRPFSIPMILLNLTLEMEWMLPAGEFRDTLDGAVREITTMFIDPDHGYAHEFTAPDGSHVDCFEGRLINPGHTIEGTWFLMDAAQRLNDAALLGTAVDTLLRTLAFGWDTTYGGLFSFLDSAHKPPQQLEWDQKLWWVHAEALVALAMACRRTRSPECLEWLIRVHDYTWSHFPDPRFGEWFGYLNRRGEILLTSKGGKWKGCFHVPRALYRCATLFAEVPAGE